MKTAVFSTKSYDRQFLEEANRFAGAEHELRFIEARLSSDTAMLAGDAQAVCVFVNDTLDCAVLGLLHQAGVRLVVLRCAGFNNVDLVTARELGIAVGRVPAYSPEAVAEHTAALILTLNRKTHRAYARVREGNFELDGLIGFDLKGRTVAIIGTGKIGLAFARIMRGFGCEVLGCDPFFSADFIATGARYAAWDEALMQSDIISMHCPLTPETHHPINSASIARMKRGVMLINTGRGALVDTSALIAGLKNGQIGHVGLDVYEEEGDLFFENLSDQIIQDDVFARLLTFPNVLVTGHQAFFTTEAMVAIAATTIANLSAFAVTGHPAHPISLEMMA